jgi:hypothetical protein
MSASIFKTKQVKIDTLGEYLASVRKQLDLDVRAVSNMTQIKPEYLEGLEAGSYEKLPADVYVRGFLKSLANFYHIKEKILIDQYEKERGFEVVAKTPAASSAEKLSLTPRRIVLGASVLVGLLAVTYVGAQIKSVLAPPFLQIEEPASDLTVADNTIVIAGKGEVGAQIFINNQPVLTDAEGQFSENLVLSQGLNVIEILERNKFNKVSRVTRQITAQVPQGEPVAAAELTLTVNVSPNPTWVYLEADGLVVQRGTMLAGSTKTVTAKNQIIVTSADAGSTQIIYNNKDLGKLGRNGEVIRNVEFSQSSQ